MCEPKPKVQPGTGVDGLPNGSHLRSTRQGYAPDALTEAHGQECKGLLGGMAYAVPRGGTSGARPTRREY